MENHIFNMIFFYSFPLISNIVEGVSLII